MQPNSLEKKMEWLNGHGLESDNTISLGDCYRCATKLIHTFSIVFKLLTSLNGSAEIKGSAALRKYFNVFFGAMSQGVVALSNHIDTNATSMLREGRFADEAAALRPVDISDMPTLGDDHSTKPSTSDMTLDVVSHNPSFTISLEY